MSALKERERKSFVFHHVAGPIKSIVFFSGIYPAWQVVLSDANFNTPVVLGSTVCMGDMLMVAVQLFCSLYLAELLFRVESIGMLSVAHHIATILTANVAYGLSGYTQRYPEACVEIYLCIVWGKCNHQPTVEFSSMLCKYGGHRLISSYAGFFDLIATAPLDPVLIARRLVRNTHPINIHYSLYATAAWSLIMTLLEIAATSYFLYGGWDRLSLAVWLVTPLCFGIWAVSQVHSAHVLRILAKGQEKMIEKRRDQEDIDVERIEGTGGISSASSGRLSVEKAL